jgi:hypothetical protein
MIFDEGTGSLRLNSQVACRHKDPRLTDWLYISINCEWNRLHLYKAVYTPSILLVRLRVTSSTRIAIVGTSS